MIRHLLVPALAVVVATSACAVKDDRTQVTVVLTSETEIPKELDALEITVTAANGSTVYDNVYTVRDPAFFATTLAVIPADSDSLKGPITVEIKGKSGNTVGVFRRAVVSYVKGRTLMLPMPLRMACFNFKDCGAASTCAGGTCQPATVSGDDLRDYDDKLVFETRKDLCFDEDACLRSAAPVKVNADCTFALPKAAAAGGRPDVNVSIRWAAASNRVIVLDEGDGVEGWTVVPENPSLGRVSAGVCKSLLDPEPDPEKREVPDQALDARISVGCAAKSPTQPFCRRAGNLQSGIGAEIPVR
jgi:hypothetical protein